jgi:hypothetical protein
VWRATAQRWPRIELLAAVAVAGFFYRRMHGWRACLKQTRHLARVLSLKPQVNAMLSEARLGYCRECPHFYAPLRTCGSPLVDAMTQIGCWCHMPTKAGHLENCWEYDRMGRSAMYRYIGWGWPEELNSWPFEKT